MSSKGLISCLVTGIGRCLRVIISSHQSRASLTTLGMSQLSLKDVRIGTSSGISQDSVVTTGDTMAENTSLYDAIHRHQQYPDLEAQYLDSDFQRRRISMVAAYIKPGERVLDVGCNSGYFVKFCPKGCEVHGIDTTESVIPRAKELLASAQVASAEAIPFPDKFFDVVVLSEVLEHVYDADVVMKELVRVARRAIVISTPHETGSWGEDTIKHHTYHVRCYREASLRELILKYCSSVEIKICSCMGKKECYVAGANV